MEAFTVYDPSQNTPAGNTAFNFSMSTEEPQNPPPDSEPMPEEEAKPSDSPPDAEPERQTEFGKDDTPTDSPPVPVTPQPEPPTSPSPDPNQPSEPSPSEPNTGDNDNDSE